MSDKMDRWFHDDHAVRFQWGELGSPIRLALCRASARLLLGRRPDKLSENLRRRT
jgi:hypothetical protein